MLELLKRRKKRKINGHQMTEIAPKLNVVGVSQLSRIFHSGHSPSSA